MNTTTRASTLVILTGILWGVYWLPVRALTDLGLPGAWGTLAITSAAALILTPLAIRSKTTTKPNATAIAFIALGGAAFALYSIGFVFGRVALIILLFFLTPVWSTLIARFIMGWHTPRLRYVAIAAGLAGLAIMLSAGGDAPIPRNIGEWMALISGLFWAIATTGMRAKSNLKPLHSAAIFALGAAAASLILAPLLAPWPTTIPALAAPLALATGLLWWGLSIAGLMWATLRLDPARVGILLMAEILIGLLSAALLAGEHLAPLEILGGGLVLIAGVLEVWPTRKP